MLKGMRRSAKHILWPLTIAMVISMGGYGVWYLVRPEASRTEIGAAWGEPVRRALAIGAMSSSGQVLFDASTYDVLDEPDDLEPVDGLIDLDGQSMVVYSLALSARSHG